MRREYAYLAIFAAVLILLRAGTFIVDETQQAIITQFGEPRGEPITEPGLHFKLPFVQKINYFDKRFLEWDGDSDEMPTKDKRFISVDTYARWRIADPLKFFQRLRDERGGRSRLGGILNGETRNAIAKHNLVEIVRSSNREDAEVPEKSEEETVVLEKITKGRNDITRSILETASPKVKDFGIELIDLQFKRINYVEEVQKDVFARMIAERKRVAARYRSEGEGEAARIGGEQERELQRIQSEAYRSAQEIRGEADGKATQIYAAAYNRDPSFYAFTKSMETYEKGVDSQTTLVLTTKGDLLKYLVRPE